MFARTHPLVIMTLTFDLYTPVVYAPGEGKWAARGAMGIGWIAQGHHDLSLDRNCQNPSSFSVSYERLLCIDAVFETVQQTIVRLVLDDLHVIDSCCNVSLNCPLKNASS